jgi:hypothetical protein
VNTTIFLLYEGDGFATIEVGFCWVRQRMSDNDAA